MSGIPNDVGQMKYISFSLKMMLKGGCLVLRLVILNFTTPLLMSSLRGTSLQARPLGL